jgi:hypothetical protein
MTPNAFRRVPLRVTRQLDYPEFSCRPIPSSPARLGAATNPSPDTGARKSGTVRPIPAEHLHAIYTQEPWTYPEAYQREVVDTGEWLNRPSARSGFAVALLLWGTIAAGFIILASGAL